MARPKMFNYGCGRIIYAPKPLIEYVDEVSKENNIKKGKALIKIFHDAKEWNKLERKLKGFGVL
jgi:hypothetical protein